jgi:hypothetical protein
VHTDSSGGHAALVFKAKGCDTGQFCGCILTVQEDTLRLYSRLKCQGSEVYLVIHRNSKMDGHDRQRERAYKWRWEQMDKKMTLIIKLYLRGVHPVALLTYDYTI